MAPEHHYNLGIEYRKEADKHSARMIFFGALMLISHLLTIQPSEIETEGIKIAVGDVAVIRGGIALIYFYYLFRSLNLIVHGAFLMPFSIEKSMLRWFLRVASRPQQDSKTKRRRRPTVPEKKRDARWGIALFNIVMSPFYIAVMSITLMAFLFAVGDVYDFGAYAVEKLAADHEAEMENEINALVNALQENLQ